MIRILIVDDSITQREILCTLLEAEPEFTVVGEARDGVEAIDRAETLYPDVILMDVHMPKLDGIEATRVIMENNPIPIVIVSSTLRKQDIDHGLAALKAGAMTLLQKPTGAALLHLKSIGPELRQAIFDASGTQLTRPASGPTQPTHQQPLPSDTQHLRKIAVVGICTSTGGPSVLVEILSSLPKPYPLPVLLVQHIGAAFVEGFATWLRNNTGQPVQIAADQQLLVPGVWLPPAGFHITLGNSRHIRLVAQSASDVHCPSGTPLFESLAKHAGEKALGLQLTGMGDDGVDGLLKLIQAGGQVLVQDEASSMIYGMPKAAKTRGAITQELPPSGMAAWLKRIASL